MKNRLIALTKTALFSALILETGCGSSISAPTANASSAGTATTQSIYMQASNGAPLQRSSNRLSTESVASNVPSSYVKSFSLDDKGIKSALMTMYSGSTHDTRSLSFTPTAVDYPQIPSIVSGANTFWEVTINPHDTTWKANGFCGSAYTVTINMGGFNSKPVGSSVTSVTCEKNTTLVVPVSFQQIKGQPPGHGNFGDYPVAYSTAAKFHGIAGEWIDFEPSAGTLTVSTPENIDGGATALKTVISFSTKGSFIEPEVVTQGTFVVLKSNPNDGLYY